MADARFRGRLAWGAWLGGLGLAFVALPAAAQTPAAKPVTFTKDVAPIFQKACENCHRKDSIGPMSLVTYEEARPWARSIKARVSARQMPPWHIDKTVGIQEFKNDRSLTDEQIETIVKWVDAGAPKGDMRDMPPPVKWPNEETWNFADMFGEPDLIIRSPEYTMPARAQDAWYKPTVPTGITEPRWVRAIEMRPSTVAGRKITHHALARLQQEVRLQRGLILREHHEPQPPRDQAAEFDAPVRVAHHPRADGLSVAARHARIGARRTLFTHLAHDVDHSNPGELPPGIELAHDGLVFDFE